MAHSKVLTLGPPRVAVVVLDAGDSAMDVLLDYAREQRVNAASLTAIGGFSTATLGYFDVDAKEYQDIPVREQAEVLSLTGDIVPKDDDWQVHAHAVLGLRDGTTRGGHLKDATVRPTLEVMLTDTPRQLVRRYDERSGLALIDLKASAASLPLGGGPTTANDSLRRGVTGDLRS